MAAGLGVFQHNTGVFLNRGAVLNYAFSAEIAPGFNFASGLNIFGYQRQLADDRFQINPGLPLPQPEESNDFIIQIAPSMLFNYGPVSLGVVVENLLEYNLSTSENQITDSGNIFIGFLGSRIPVNLFMDAGSSYLQPTVYVKRLPDNENQVGITTLFSTPKFWVQGGYNNFYGVSGGIGGRFFKNFSIGALIEYGISSDLQDQNPTFELITAYNFGPQFNDRKEDMELEDQEETIVETDIIKAKDSLDQKARVRTDVKQPTDSVLIAKTKKQKRLERKRKKDSLRAYQKKQDEKLAQELMQRRQDSIASLRREKEMARAQKTQDSIQAVQEALKAAAQKKRDSLEAIQKKKDSLEAIQKRTRVTPVKGEKYEEVVNEEGIAPGYYLIANVFGTKRYYDAFMKTLRERGLNPKSFYRASRKFNYVYLGKYNTLKEARQARDSKLNGRYKEDLWIFRMVAKE